MAKNEFPDLKDASLEDIQAQIEKLRGYAKRRMDAKKREALGQIRELVQANDLSYEEVIQVIRTATRRGKAPAIYRNPENPRQTWSGKGDAPDWFKNAADPESLRIPGA